MLYCVIPLELAGKLHELLRAHFRDDPAVEVVVERRGRERRLVDDRRGEPAACECERRRIHSDTGRRIGARRAPVADVAAPALPRKARAHAERIVFVERVEPSAEHLADLDSARLVTRFQAGEPDAFAGLYMRYFDRVYGYLRAVFRHDVHAVEDLTQQVFVKVFEALPRYERRGQPFRAWLFTIVRNVARSELRMSGRSEAVEPHVIAERYEAPSTDEATSVLTWLTDRELVMFVERLSVSQRQVLVLKYMLDLPTKEVAQILGRQQDDVRALESRALRFLEARLTAVGRHPTHVRRTLPTYGRTRWMHVARKRRAALRRNPGRVRM